MTGDGPRPERPGQGPHLGDLVGGHRIERPLGAGAMGTVWLAEHETLRRRVALKILAHGLADDPAFQDRFTREARLAARLDHPNVVAVYDAGTDPAGLWLSMRYVEGEDLRRRLNRVARRGGPGDPAGLGDPARSPSPFRRPEASPEDPDATLPAERRGGGPAGLAPAEAVRIVEDVAAGLDHAHSRGILHRDVKPGNVLVEAADASPAGASPAGGGEPPDVGGVALPPFRRALLADFGLTKELEDHSGDLTQTGMLLGSADSVAPEQIEGRAVDARVDVYALGSLLYVALTGAPPFPGVTMAKLFGHVNGDRPRVSALLPQLRAFDAVIAAGMAKDPGARPSTAGELAGLARDAIARLDVDPQATVDFPAPSPPRDRRPAPRPRPVPPSAVPPVPRMRDEPTPTEPRTRVAPADEPRTRVAPAAGSRTRAAAADPAGESRTRVAPDPARAGGGASPPEVPGDPGNGARGSRRWLVPALVVGALVLGPVVVLGLALSGGDDGSDRAAADPTTTRTTSSSNEEPTGSSTTTPAAPETAARAPSTTAPAAPAGGGEVTVRGGGTIAAGAATRDPGAGQPLAGTGVPADYVAPDGTWRTLVARPEAGWEAPRRSRQGSALTRLRQAGPDGRLILVDHTPRQAASFDTSNVSERRTFTGTRFGDVTGYRFSDARIASIPECARMPCVDVPLNQSDQGPGWGVLVAAPTAEEAWATVERLARSTGP